MIIPSESLDLKSESINFISHFVGDVFDILD